MPPVGMDAASPETLDGDRMGASKMLNRTVCAALAILIGAPLFGADKKGELPNGLYAVFTTSEGEFTARLYEKYTPKSVANFVGLATGTKAWKDPQTKAMVMRPMYDNITFHRVLRDVMIQSGDPTGTSAHDCGFTIPDEILIGLRFDAPGKLAVANAGKADTGACQFFITTQAMSQWNDKYTIFGEVVSGMPVVMTINHGQLIGDKPETPVKLISVRIQRVGPEPKSKKK
jgi:peptidyl-prolyl cis-trans isomerase A (cyclophilin A)